MQARVSTGKKKSPDGWPSENGKRGIRPLIQGNSTLWAEVKGVRIVTHACLNPALSIETIGLATLIHSSVVMITTHYLCTAIALKIVIYWLPLISDVVRAPWVVHLSSDLSWYDWCEGLHLKAQTAPDPHRWEMHTVRWSEGGNKWRWLRPFRVGNEEILQRIPAASATGLNETLVLNALSGMELHANLQVALWPADNCGAVLRERFRRFSPGLQLRGLHITIHNRLNT